MPLADGGQQHLSRASGIPLFGKPVAITLKTYKYHFPAELSNPSFTLPPSVLSYKFVP
jgi:hypothetical protein